MKLKIAENIRKYRLWADMTQDELAERLGVSHQSVSRWENGTTYPDIELLPAMGELFAVTIDKLIGAAKEDREEASAEYYAKLNATIDHEKRLSLLREIHREYPRDSTIIWNLCGTTEDLDEQRKLTKLLIELCGENDSVYVNQAIGWLINTEEENKLDSLLNEHTAPFALCREMRLEERYLHRREWDKYEYIKEDNLRRAVIDIVLPRLADHTNSLYGYKTALDIINLLAGTTGMNPVSGDCIPDLWYKERLYYGFRYSHELAASGKDDEALAVIEDITDLYEKFWTLPDKTVLTYRCPSLEKIEATLHYLLLSTPEAEPDYGNGIKYNARSLVSKDFSDIHALFRSNYDYHPLIANKWQGFDVIRNDPRYERCLLRMRAFESEKLILER